MAKVFRSVLLGLLLSVSLGEAQACSCFSPEQRAKTAQDALQGASLAGFGRVAEVDAAGNARVILLESYKGPPAGSSVELKQDEGSCTVKPMVPGEIALILSFRTVASTCDRYPPDHYLIQEFRLLGG